LQKLKELGQYDNTIIIFYSDNGPVITGGARSDYFENAKPFNQSANRLKGSVFEGGIHVPLIVSWPAKMNNSRVSDHICAAYDIFPTICDLLGTEKPEDLDGISIMPTILGKGNQKEHDFLYWEYPERRGQQAVRMGEWKGVRDSTLDGNRKIQLFNLEKDITESENVAAANPEIVKRIEEIMVTEHSEPEVERFRIFR
jgi:arylsulfatase A-like enzyme